MGRKVGIAFVFCLILACSAFWGSLAFARFGAAASSEPLEMRVSITPESLPADGGAYQSLFVQLATSSGKVVASPQNYRVFLTSSEPEAATVQSSLVFQQGAVFAAATIFTTNRPGSTNITLSATGVAPAIVVVTTHVPTRAPAKLAVFSAPPVIFAGSSGYYLVIQLQDVNGTPARASSQLNLTLTSSAPSVLETQQSVEIPADGTYAASIFSTGPVNGSSAVTVQLNGLASDSIVVKTIYLPFSITLYSDATGALFTHSHVTFTVAATSAGLPVSGASVNWTVSPSGDRFTNGSLTTDGKGLASATLFLGAAGNATVSAKVSEAGFGERSTSMVVSVQALPLSVTLIPSSTQVNVSQPSTVIALVTSSGRPVSGAQVSWSSTLGGFDPPAGSTDSSGTALSSFLAPTAGVANITADASGQGYSPGTGTASIFVGAASISGAGSGGGLLGFIPGPGVFGVPVYLVAGVVLIVLAVTVLRRRRRRKSKTAKAEGEDETQSDGGDE